MHLQDHCLAGLKAIRERENIPAKDLAKAIGTNLASYYRFERGDRRIHFDRAVRLSKILNCSLYDFLTDPTIPERAAVQQVEADEVEAAEALGDWEA